MVGDNEELEKLAEKLLQTYTIADILEQNDILDEELIYLLLINGLIDPDIPVEL